MNTAITATLLVILALVLTACGAGQNTGTSESGAQVIMPPPVAVFCPSGAVCSK